MSSKRSKVVKGKSSGAKHTSLTGRSASVASGTASAALKGKTDSDLPQAGYLIACDIPTKQYIQYLNDKKSMDKKFILQDLDATHVLVKVEARNDIEREIKVWLDENVYSAIEKVGEDLDVS